MYYGYKISDHTVALAERAEHDCAEVFKRIDENALKCSAKGLSAFQNARVSTADFIEVVQEVLTDEEKAYFSAVIKPFKEDVSEIVKFEYQEFEYIRLVLRYDSINFPIFAKGKIYKGMEKAKKYTLEELDL